MKKITILGANVDTGNMGVGALMMGAIACIKHAWPHAEISLMDYDDRSKVFNCRIGATSVPVRMIALRFSKKFYLPNNIAFLLLSSILLRMIPSRVVRRKFTRKNTCLNHMHKSDMVLSIAGGDSFSDIYGQERFIYIALPLLWSIAMRKNVQFLPQTIGPFKSHFAASMAAFIMKRCSCVYARDNESLQEAKRLMGKRHAEKAHFCYDMAFVLNPLKPAIDPMGHIVANKNEKLIVGLNVSGLLCIGGYNRKNMFALKGDYSELVRSLIRYLIKDKGAIILLVPHVFGAVPESDVSAAKRFYDELSGELGADLQLVEGSYDQNEIKYIIGQCDFFIGSRMHACIAALSQSVPAIGIAYSRKFAGVMQSIGMDELIADSRKSTNNEILELIGRALVSRDTWAHQLCERLPHVTSAVLNVLVEKPKIRL